MRRICLPCPLHTLVVIFLKDQELGIVSGSLLFFFCPGWIVSADVCRAGHCVLTPADLSKGEVLPYRIRRGPLVRVTPP